MGFGITGIARRFLLQEQKNGHVEDVAVFGRMGNPVRRW